jgi:homospermidine synthase
MNEMTEHSTLIDFPGRIVFIFIGFGSIGQGVLPLVLRHVGIPAERVTIVTAEDRGIAEAGQYGVKFIKEPLTRENFRRILEPLVGRGDFVLNVSVEVSSIALVKYCWERGAMYLDTCIEPWAGGYTDPGVPAAKRTNYALREDALALRPGNARAPTAVLTHGANPGLVSHFVKQALLNIAADTGVDARARRPGKERLVEAGAGARRARDPHRRARHAGLRRCARSSTNSSTPGRSTDSSARARSPASSAGARTSAISRATVAATISAAARRSGSPSPARPRACAPGRRRSATSTASRSPMASRSRSPTISVRARRRPGGLPADRPLRVPPL